MENMVVSPENILELGVGYSITEGYLTPETYNGASILENKIYVTSNGLKNTPKSLENKIIKLSTIKKIMETMPTLSDTWKITGGVHWAALFDFSGNKIIYFEVV